MKNQLGCFRKPSWLMSQWDPVNQALFFGVSTKSWMISNMAFNTPWSSLDGLHVVMVSLGSWWSDVWLSSSDRILGLINTISIYICYKISIFSLVQHDIIKLHHLVRWRPLVTPTSQVGTYRAAEVGGHPMRVFFKEYCTDKWRMIRHYIFFYIFTYIYVYIYIYMW